MDDDYDLHMLDVIRVCYKRFEAVKQDHIALCMKASGNLPVGDTTNMVQVFERIEHTSGKSSVLDR